MNQFLNSTRFWVLRSTFLPLGSRWGTGNFPSTNVRVPLVFNRFLHQNTIDCQWISATEIKVIFSRFLAHKLRWFSLFYYLKNQLNSARFIVYKINWIQLIFVVGKSTEFSSFYCLHRKSSQLESRLANLKVEEYSIFGHFWKAHDQTNPTRYGTKCSADTTHIIKYFFKFWSIKQT